MRSRNYSIWLAVVLVVQLTFSSATNAQLKPLAMTNPLSEMGTGVDNYPPSRFQSGRPSTVTGLKVLSSNVDSQTVTFSWNTNPLSEHVDQYAIYYQGYVSAPNEVDLGVLAAVVSKNLAKVTLIGFDGTTDQFNPYAQNEIPICTTSYCPLPPNQAKVWVIAHNRFGWGDNAPFAANPDENPADFSMLSSNQEAALKPPNYFTLNLKTINSKFLTLEWPYPTLSPDYSEYERQFDPTNIAKPLAKTKWMVPWVPSMELPTSRFGPGRPSGVTGVKVSLLDLKKKQITISWKASPSKESVDEYALYLTYPVCPDDSCTTWLVAIVRGTSISQQLNFDVMPFGDDFAKVSDGKTLTLLPISRPYTFSVIAHNKFGWGDNGDDTPNPDQFNGDFRPLSRRELEQPNSGISSPFASSGNGWVDISIPCTVLPMNQQSTC